MLQVVSNVTVTLHPLHTNDHFSKSPILAGPSGPALTENPRVIIVGEDPRLKCRQLGFPPWVDHHERSVAFAHPGRKRFACDRIANPADVAWAVVLADGFHGSEQSHFLLRGRVIQISAGLLEIRFLEFAADKLTAKA